MKKKKFFKLKEKAHFRKKGTTGVTKECESGCKFYGWRKAKKSAMSPERVHMETLNISNLPVLQIVKYIHTKFKKKKNN